MNSSSLFQIGSKYERKDIFRILKLDPIPTGGNWFNGYVRHVDEYFVFVNIGTVARTGHDYGDQWLENGNLFWHGQTKSHIAQPMIQAMITPGTVVHFFTRNDSRDPAFVYQGVGKAITVNLTTPVEIIWKFDHKPL